MRVNAPGRWRGWKLDATHVALALALVVGLGAALAPASVAVAAKSLKVRSAPVRGSLVLDATSSAGRTVVKVRGTLRVRSRVQVRALRCFDRRCRGATRRGRAVLSVRPGRRAISKRLSVRVAKAVWVEIRHHGDRLARRRVVPRLVSQPPGPGGGGGPVGPGATPAPAPRPLELTTTPALNPAYAPDVPDYTTRCTGEDVVVDATVPAGMSLAIDGAAPHTATTVRQQVGLQAGQAFRFTVDDAAGRREHVVRCVPADFPAWTVQRDGKPEVAWLAFSPSIFGAPYAVIADSHGVPVWWMKSPGPPIDVKLLPDRSVVWGRWSGGPFSQTFYDHVSLDGGALAPITTVGIGADHHDLQVLPNGNRLLVAYRRRDNVDLTAHGGLANAAVLDGEIQEVTQAGTLVWSWNSKDHIALAETASWGVAGTLVNTADGPAYDIFHINSVEPDGDGLVMSARHVNAIYRIRLADGAVSWKLGGTARPESLSFVGDPLGAASFGGQHDARVLPDGTITLYDNGTNRNRPPRAVRYSLNTTTRTATLIEQVVDSRAPTSGCCNSSRRQPGGRWVVTNDAQRTVSELTSTGQPVLTLQFAAGFTYRAVPYAAGDVQRDELRAGMDAMFPRP